MKRLLPILLCITALISCSAPKECFVETESFSDRGGWTLTPQYMDQMGSPYLQAHGIGKPVTDASTEVTLPSKGEYHVFVRTYNWTSPWTDAEGAGKFQVKIDGSVLPAVLGCTGKSWEWQYAGAFRASKRKIILALTDLRGFDGRCDAVYFSPVSNPDLSDTEALRERLVKREKIDRGEFDFVVVGGGLAGMCAAVAASRLGLKTALVHDRSVLGGNNSSEIRVHASGSACLDPYPNLGNMIREFGHDKVMNGANDGTLYGDANKKAFVEAEKNLTVFYNEHVTEVNMDGDRIASVSSRNTSTGAVSTFRAPLFADCTGDANVGYLAGADYRVGRESKDQTGERSATWVADKQVLGSSVLWNSVEEPGEFPIFEYGLQFTEESMHPIFNGEWTWETGMRRDQIAEAERIRDYGMLVAYSNWSFVKNRSSRKEEFTGRRLNWVSSVAGKRESRRLLGDYILNQTDVEGFNLLEDATVTLSWPVDLHYPNPNNTKFFPGEEFISVCNQEQVPYYPIPYRCFYSRNVSNLFMAGRDISVTHAALGTIRVMRTTAMMGEVVGMAASVCKAHSSLPRSVYESYFLELKELMKEGAGKKGLPDTQNYGLGRAGAAYNERFSSPDVE